MNQSDRDFLRIKEKVETLTGERGSSKKPDAAVLRGDMTFLSGLSMLSTPVTSAPTQEQFNALQADIAAIYAAVVALAKQ